MAKSLVSSVGARYGVVFTLDTNGRPSQAVASATPETGVRISGLQTATGTDADPQTITHYGDDFPFAQDSLGPTDVESYDVTTAKTNLTLDAYVTGSKERTYGDQLRMLAQATDKQGDEPRVMAMFYRQALDTDPDSASFGSLRQYEGRIYPSSRLITRTAPYEQANSPKSYSGIPTPVEFAPWGEDINQTNWGVAQGGHIDFTCDYHPRFNVYKGDGTIDAFSLTHTPVSSDYLKVWVDGTLTTPSAVDTDATNPAFTLSAAPAADVQIFAFIQTATPKQATN